MFELQEKAQQEIVWKTRRFIRGNKRSGELRLQLGSILTLQCYKSRKFALIN